jgi:hypothetical protein
VATVDEFLSNHSDLEEADDEVSAGTDGPGVRLDVTILGISANAVRFVHLGTEYRVDRAAVRRIDDRQDPANPGRAATLVVDKDAPLVATYSVSSTDLVTSLPFAMSRPPITPRPKMASPREVAWRNAQGAPMMAMDPAGGGYPSLAEWLSAVSTTTACESSSGGDLDDNIGDDQCSDYY